MKYDGFFDDEKTLRAMREAPEYWLRWYTWKSLALVGALAWVAFLYGKHAR